MSEHTLKAALREALAQRDDLLVALTALERYLTSVCAIASDGINDGEPEELVNARDAIARAGQ